MPWYRAFGLAIRADQRIPALDGVEIRSPGEDLVADLVVQTMGTTGESLPELAFPHDSAAACMIDSDSVADKSLPELAFPREHLEEPATRPWYETPADDSGQVLRVWRRGDGGYRFVYSDGAEFLVAAGGRHVVAGWPPELTLDDAVEYLLGPVVGFALRAMGVVCLHASGIAAGDAGCFAVLAPGGHGKSTTAAACARRGLAVLTDDVLALLPRDGGFSVLPAYPRIRLWPEAVTGLFGAPDALPRITPGNADWQKRYLDLTAPGYSFQSVPLPLRAVYTHEREEAEPATFEELTAAEALVTLLANVYSLCRPDAETRAREFNLLEQLARSVPVKRFRGRFGIDQLDAQCALLRADCLAAAAVAG
jgi:hypothetical protein